MSRPGAGLLNLLILISLILNAIALTGGTQAQSDPIVDLAIEDIWYDENLTVHCRLMSLGFAYSGMFYLNLTVNGDPHSSDPQIMTDWKGVMNVSFQQRIIWEGESVEVTVNVHDPQWAPDGNPMNDARTEVWHRDLPNLRIRSVFRDPLTAGTTAVIENGGFKTAEAPFNVTLSLNGTFYSQRTILDDLLPWARVPVDMEWAWNTERSPVNINVTVDTNDEVHELDEEDNTYLVTWETRPLFDFAQDPAVTYAGRTNATISLRTSIPANFEIAYGQDPTMSSSISLPGPNQHTEAELVSLDPGTQYLFRVHATDGYGRTISTDVHHLITLSPERGKDPTIRHSSELIYNWTDDVRVPIDIDDDVGIKKVDVYVNGKLYRSFGGLGKKSMKELDLGKPFEMKYLGPNWDDMRLSVRVTDDEGGESFMDLPSMRVFKEIEIPYPKVVWNPSTDRVYRGTEMLVARCEDPGGMTSATWLVDGVVIDTVSARHPHASYFGPWTTWDTTLFSDGLHDVTLEVLNNDGNVTRATRRLNVENMIPPSSPEIWVRRENIRRDGTVCTVRLNVTNHGLGDAVNLIVIDNIKGFVPLDGDEGTHPVFGNGRRWHVHLSAPLIRSGETIWLEYRAIPVLYNEEEWVLGHEMPRPDDPSSTYTTSYSYQRSDGLVSYSRMIWIPPANFEDGHTMEAGVRLAIAGSNYLMITNPVLLQWHFVFARGYFEMLSECAELLALKNGVFGFIHVIRSSSPTPERILDTIIQWKDLLHPEFDSRGYIAILGEDEIIPTWTYHNVLGSDGVHGSDHGYSNLNGGNTPEIVVGRFLGNTPDRLLEPVRTSIGVARGTLRNDHDGNAVIMSGGGDGVRAFMGSAEELHWLISDDMRSCSVHHISDSMVIEDQSFEFDGKSRHMDAGDLDGDGTGEVVFLDPAANRVHIFHPDTGASSHFHLEMTDRAAVKVGWLNTPDFKMIAIFDDFPDGDEYKYMPMDGTVHYRTRTGFDTDDPVCLMNYDESTYNDEIVRGDVGTNRIHIYDRNVNEITSFPAANIRAGHRIDTADMDGDGDPDIIVADHHNDKLHVYLNPTWERIEIEVDDLDPVDGFGAGNIMYKRRGSREDAVVVHSDTGFLEVCWLELDDDGVEWLVKTSKSMITPASADCAVAVTGMQGEGGYEEIVLSIGGWADRTLVLDYANSSLNFKARMSGIVPNKDLLVYRDHGNQNAWSGLYSSGDIDRLNFRYSHRPVVVGLVCLSGRFHDSEDSFAQAVMRSGAGVYIGATEVSYRPMNNNAVEFIEQYVQGKPIGIALRDIKRKVITGDTGLELSDEHHRYWTYEYNLYGDPAFGTDGRPWYPPVTRAAGSVRIEIGPIRMINDTDGQRARIPGGSELHVIGKPMVPYITYEIDIPPTETVTSVILEMNGDWTYHYDLDLMDLEGYPIDGYSPGYGYLSASRNAGGEAYTSGDLFPSKSMDWRVKDDGLRRVLVVDIFPFQHDPYSGISRICHEWTIHYTTTRAPVELIGWEGAKDVLEPGEYANFCVRIEPLDGGGTVAVSQRIENSGGELVERLPSSVIEINSTTVFESEWKTDGPSGRYVYIIEFRTEWGAPLRSLRIPFSVGGAEVELPYLGVEDATFKEGSSVNASMILRNNGAEPVQGWFSISLMDQNSTKLKEINGSATISPLTESEFVARFDIDGIQGDILGIIGMFSADLGTVVEQIRIIREGTEPEGHVPFTPSVSFEHDEEILEGESLSIVGHVIGPNGSGIPMVPVGAWVGDKNYAVTLMTDGNGTFSIEMEGLKAGNWTLWIMCLFGDRSILESSPVLVKSVDDPVDDNRTDEDPADDAPPPPDGNKYINIWICVTALLIVIMLIAILAIVLLMARRSSIEE